MTERRKPVEQIFDLPWFVEQFNLGFEHLAEIPGYTDEQNRRLEGALYQLEPVPDELDDLLVNLGVLPD